MESIDLKVQVDTEEIKRIPKDVAQGFARLNQDMGALKGPQGDLAKEYARRMREISETAAGQGFLSPQQLREFEKSSRGLQRIFSEHYRDLITAAKGGAAKFEQEINDIATRLSKAQGKEKDELRRQLGQTYKEYQQFMVGGGAVNVGPLQQARATTMQGIEGLHAQAQLTAFQAPPPPPAPEAPQEQGGIGAGMATAMRFGRGLVGAYSVYAIASRLRRDFESELERRILVADIGQTMRPVGMRGEEFQNIAKEIAPSLRPEESTRFLREYTALAGTRGNLAGTFNQAEQAVGLTRALGITPEEGAQQFGQVTRMGLDQDRFAKKLAEETAAAQMRGRMGEMTSTLIGMADELTQRLGRVPDQDALTGLLGRLSAQGVPGLQGAYGAARVQSIDEAFRGQSLFNLPNLGPLAEFQMFSTMGVRDPVKMWQMQQQGLMAHPEMWKG